MYVQKATIEVSSIFELCVRIVYVSPTKKKNFCLKSCVYLLSLIKHAVTLVTTVFNACKLEFRCNVQSGRWYKDCCEEVVADSISERVSQSDGATAFVKPGRVRSSCKGDKSIKEKGTVYQHEGESMLRAVVSLSSIFIALPHAASVMFFDEKRIGTITLFCLFGFKL